MSEATTTAQALDAAMKLIEYTRAERNAVTTERDKLRRAVDDLEATICWQADPGQLAEELECVRAELAEARKELAALKAATPRPVELTDEVELALAVAGYNAWKATAVSRADWRAAVRAVIAEAQRLGVVGPVVEPEKPKVRRFRTLAQGSEIAFSGDSTGVWNNGRKTPYTLETAAYYVRHGIWTEITDAPS